MVSYADVCLFTQNLTKPLRLSRDDIRDSTRNREELKRALPGCAPLYHGQYHIDFWLSRVENYFTQLHIPEEDKCDCVAKVFAEDVIKAYDAMQSNRIHRGEAAIKDWPTLKAILRYVFLPLTQLDTTLLVQPSPDDPVSDLSRKTDSLSLLPSSSNTKKVDLDKAQDEAEKEAVKEMIEASRHKLTLVTEEIPNLIYAAQDKLVLATKDIQYFLHEQLGTRDIHDLLEACQDRLVFANQDIQDLLAQCSSMLSPSPMAAAMNQEA